MLARVARATPRAPLLRRALSSKGVSVRVEDGVEVSKPQADKSSMSAVRAPRPRPRAARGELLPLPPRAAAPALLRPGRPVAHPPARPRSAAQFTGAPTGMLETRTVRIFQQSQGVETGTQNTLSWRMQWEDDQTRRWTNPLMGWSSTSDPLSNTHMTLEFESAEAAVKFCDRNGWSSEVVKPKPNRSMLAKPRQYAANFGWKGPKGRDFPDLYIPPPPPPPKE